LKNSHGFKKINWSIITIISAASSLLLLSHSMNTLEVGVSYSIWVAFGSIGSMILVVFLFKEKMNWLQFVSMTIILVSVIGLKLS
ncbi:QacE family quaternary ammonium compound efflux SMR transporter, partial [Enterococcus hirae]